MADVTAGQEIIFRIPRDKVARGQGCGLDFGELTNTRHPSEHTGIHLTNTQASI